MAAWILLGASVAWLAALAATAAGALEPVSAAIYRFGSFICHQQPDRSFHSALQWPVCARCLGLYAAAPAGALAALAIRARLARSGTVLLLCVAALPTAATWIAERAMGVPVGNMARFAAALPLGAVVTWVVARTLADTSREYSTGMN